MRGVRGVEVTDDGVSSTALEILDTGAKIPAWRQKMHQRVRRNKNSSITSSTMKGCNKKDPNARILPFLWDFYLHPTVHEPCGEMSHAFMGKIHSIPTEFGWAYEVANTSDAAIIFPLRLIELHTNPLAAGKLSGATKPQGSRLEGRQRSEAFHCSTINSLQIFLLLPPAVNRRE